MSSLRDTGISSLKIISDDVEKDPINNFGPLSDIIANIVKDSAPKFSIGIFGEWGTGKTTLMRLIERKLQNEKEIKTVWFDAWRYEREKQFTLIPLLKTIAYKIEQKGSAYSGLREIILNSIKIIGVDIGRSLLTRFLMTQKGVDELEQELRKILSERPSLARTMIELDKETIYFDGMQNINKEMEEITKENPARRIVVFIDDLDRCSPKKVLEIFESIKVFLDTEGFIYLLGLSREIILKAVKEAYKQYDIEGDEYVRKIIQLPIKIPNWDEKSIIKLIEHLVKDDKERVGKYSPIIKQHKKLIAKIVESNPREVKRFINSFMLGYEKHLKEMEKDKEEDKERRIKELFFIQALKLRWEGFYKYFSSYPEFRDIVKKYVERITSGMDDRKRMKEFEEIIKGNQIMPQKHREVISKHISEPRYRNMWEFLEKEEVKTGIFDIKDWNIYQVIVDSVMADRPPVHALPRAGREAQ